MSNCAHDDPRRRAFVAAGMVASVSPTDLRTPDRSFASMVLFPDRTEAKTEEYRLLSQADVSDVSAVFFHVCLN